MPGASKRKINERRINAIYPLVKRRKTALLFTLLFESYVSMVCLGIFFLDDAYFFLFFLAIVTRKRRSILVAAFSFVEFIAAFIFRVLIYK